MHILIILNLLISPIFTREIENSLPNEGEDSFYPFADEPLPDLPKPKDRGFSTSKNLICYYGSWSVYREGDGKFTIDNIDPFLCTHIIYAYAGLDENNHIKTLDPWRDLKDNFGKKSYERFTSLKKFNRKLKTLISIGGWNEGSIRYSRMAASPLTRRIFISSVLKFLQEHNFDGLDIDWEYPTIRGGLQEDKNNYVHLLADLKRAFKPYGYLLTAAVSSGKWNIDSAYDVPEISKYLDFINVMCFDYHGGWQDRTGHNSPLFSRPDEPLYDANYNVNFSINYWLEKGAPRNKLILGMAAFGRSFTLSNENNNKLWSTTIGNGDPGKYTKEPGILGYNEICELNIHSNWTIVTDPFYLSPYAYNGKQWVGYDDISSITLKTRLAKNLGLAGAMVWSIETDDFLGKCHQIKYPLIKTIKSELESSINYLPKPLYNKINEQFTTTARSSTLSSSLSSSFSPTWEQEENPISSYNPWAWRKNYTTTKDWEWIYSYSTKRPSFILRKKTSSVDSVLSSSSSNITCKNSGIYRNPDDCRKFYRCVLKDTNTNTYEIYEYQCPYNTVFDLTTRICLWPKSVTECAN